MYPSTRRRLGRWKVLVFAPLALLLILDRDSCAQQTLDNSTLQTPQVFRFNPPPLPALVEAAPTQQIDPASLLRIPVTVVDKAGQCVPSLRAGDFSLDVDGQESPIKLFRPNRATAAALGVLVDISQSMSFKSWHGGMISKLPFIQDAVHKVIDLLDVHDNVFLATFARRFHMLDDFTSDHDALDERLPMLRVTDQLDDFGGSGIYESLMKGIAVLNHAPKTCDRRALLVFTDIIVQGYSHEMDALAIRDGIGRIAAETGGLTFIVNGGRESDPIGVATEEIVAELDNQYLLGFPAPQNGASGNVLPVELMLRNHPGLLVRAPRAVRFRSEEFIRKALAQASTLPE
jgi:hypothetical protein